MIKGKKAGKSLEEIGKRWYDFDFVLERTIYCYLCCSREKKRKIRKLDEKLKFESYQQWKKYIWDKYERYDKDRLYEFSKYLNQRIRNIRPNREYWSIVATVLLTLVITKIVDIILNPQMNFNDIPLFVGVLFISVLVTVLLWFILIQTFYPMFDNNIDENFLRDYKEVIDEIVKVKAKE